MPAQKNSIDVAAVCGGFWWSALEGVYKAIPCGHCSGEGLRWLQAQRDFVSHNNGDQMHDPENFEAVVNEYYAALTTMIDREEGMSQQSVEAIILGQHALSRCMKCGQPPSIQVLWAEGKAQAWFCDACFRKWDAENPGEVVRQKRIDGIATRRRADWAKVAQLPVCSPVKARKVERCITGLKDNPNVNPYGVCQASVNCALPARRFREFGQDMVRQPAVEEKIRELENKVIRVVSTEELVNA